MEIVIVKKLAVMGESFATPSPLHHLDGLVEASAARLLIYIEPLEFLWTVTGRKPKQEPPTGQHIKGRLVFRIAQGVVETE